MYDSNSTNTSSITSSPWIQYRTFLIVWYATSVLLSIFGTALNFLLFCGIVSSRRLRTGSGALIAHSILVDAVLCAVILPLMYAATWTTQYGAHSENLCRWFMLALYALVWTHNWATVPIAFNRFIAIILPHFYSRLCHSKPIFAAMVSFSWSISLGCSLIYFFRVSAKSEPVKPWGGCGQTITKPREFGLITAVGTSVPTALEGVTYVTLLVYTYLKRLLQHRRVTGISPSAGQTDSSLRSVALHQRRL